jgi:hypothetical protein
MSIPRCGGTAASSQNCSTRVCRLSGSGYAALGVIPILMVSLVGGAALGQGMHTFKTEKAAQRHCPADTVVWVNTSSANYHFKGDQWYGRTQRGSYACKVEADKDGLQAWTNPR